MDKLTKFKEEIQKAYQFKGTSITLGAAILEQQCLEGVLINLPLRTINRHGLIAGATGTGKTKTLQTVAEGLSEAGVPTLLMDIKGDLSGIAFPGVENDKVKERHQKIGIPFNAEKFPVEILTISNEKGVQLRATITEFGPVLFSKILGLNDTQSGLVSLIFKFCDDEGLPLLDLKDFKKVLQYISNQGKEKIEEAYGNISTTSSATVLRKIIELEQQGAELFFGERSFDVQDLVRHDPKGKGYISVLKLTDIQDKPKLFSTFMLSLLAEIYSTFPEIGDPEKPELVIFIDEAHLIFEEASKALLDQIETIIKLIRSKGVGIIFCTQNPSDVPSGVLGQLGCKIQHALRAFTANDRKMIRLTSENYPITEYYQVEELLTSLGIGEAAVTVLSEKGTPSPLVATLLRSPRSRMGVISEEETSEILEGSELVSKYNKSIDRESAFEMLSDKIQSKVSEDDNSSASVEGKKGNSVKREKTTFEKVIESPLAKQIGKSIIQEISRGLLGVLGVKSTRSKRRY